MPTLARSSLLIGADSNRHFSSYDSGLFVGPQRYLPTFRLGFDKRGAEGIVIVKRVVSVFKAGGVAAGAECDRSPAPYTTGPLLSDMPADRQQRDRHRDRGAQPDIRARRPGPGLPT